MKQSDWLLGTKGARSGQEVVFQPVLTESCCVMMSLFSEMEQSDWLFGMNLQPSVKFGQESLDAHLRKREETKRDKKWHRSRHKLTVQQAIAMKYSE